MDWSFSEADSQALRLSLELAASTSLSLLLLCTPLSLWLAHSRGATGFLVRALVSMPLVLPPTVLGFYLLLAFAPDGAVGHAYASLGFAPPVFSFHGLWLASLVVSAPFVVQPLQSGFASIGKRPWEAAATLGASPSAAFFRVILPMARRSYLAAFVLSFAHTLGEFGVVLMVGGNIYGRTQTVSTTIFGHVEALDYASAHRLSLLLVLLGFGMIALVQLAERVDRTAP